MAADNSLQHPRPQGCTQLPAEPSLSNAHTDIPQDEIMVVRGTHKGREGKVSACYRLKFALHINGGTHSPVLRGYWEIADSGNSRPREDQRLASRAPTLEFAFLRPLGQSVPVPIAASNVVITKLKLDKVPLPPHRTPTGH